MLRPQCVNEVLLSIVEWVETLRVRSILPWTTPLIFSGSCFPFTCLRWATAWRIKCHSTTNCSPTCQVSIFVTAIDGLLPCMPLTHWGWVTHICVSKLTIIGSDNGLLPGRHQALIWTSSWILSIGPWGTNFSEILIEIQTFSFKKISLKMSFGKRRPFCLGLNVLTMYYLK